MGMSLPEYILLAALPLVCLLLWSVIAHIREKRSAVSETEDAHVRKPPEDSEESIGNIGENAERKTESSVRSDFSILQSDDGCVSCYRCTLDQTKFWVCRKCDTENRVDSMKCIVCGTENEVR